MSLPGSHVLHKTHVLEGLGLEGASAKCALTLSIRQRLIGPGQAPVWRQGANLAAGGKLGGRGKMIQLDGDDGREALGLGAKPAATLSPLDAPAASQG